MFKLTANKEDVIKFSIFSIAMFLLIAIIVNNITVFSRTGEFAGLNPFAVFLDLDTHMAENGSILVINMKIKILMDL